MTDITAAFFAAHPAALPLYECLEARILAEIPGTRVEVRKTQINFCNAHLFACVSFLPVVKAALRPPAYLVVSFGLGYRAVSPRIAAVAEPRPNRWTHHVPIVRADETDDELLSWLKEASAFAAAKRR